MKDALHIVLKTQGEAQFLATSAHLGIMLMAGDEDQMFRSIRQLHDQYKAGLFNFEDAERVRQMVLTLATTSR